MNYVDIIALIAVITSVLLGYFCYNLFQQNLQYEEYVRKDNKAKADLISQVDSFYQRHLEIFVHTALEMDKIDKKGSFSTDDEVGFAFKIVKNAIEEAREKLKELHKTED